jgi:hypothetical protein
MGGSGGSVISPWAWHFLLQEPVDGLGERPTARLDVAKVPTFDHLGFVVAQHSANRRVEKLAVRVGNPCMRTCT